jgi:hypothetical protein
MRPSAVRKSRARAEIVRTAGGSHVLLAVISEGEVGANAGDAAQIVLEHIFHSVTQHDGRRLNQALLRGLESGSRALEARRERWGPDTAVGVMAVAARHGRLFFASAGGTGAYIVAQGACKPISPRRSQPLPPFGASSVKTGPKEGVRLDPDAQLILASSSLLAESPEDGRPYVEPKDIPGYVSGNPPMEAARHLISIALGRDVAEDVAVIVIHASGRRKVGRAAQVIALGLVAVVSLVAVGAFALQQLAPRISPQTSADYGYAVLVNGDILAQAAGGTQSGPIRIQRFETIPAGSRILAQTDSRLGIQTTHEGPSDLSTLAVYISAGSIVQLTWLDLRDGAIEADPDQPAERTLIALDSGAILLRRSDGSRWTQVRVGDTTAAFSPPGPGALAVLSDSSETSIECLVGGCVLQVGQTTPVFVEAPGRVQVRDGAAGVAELLTADDLAVWNALCGDCLDIMP